MRIAITEVTRMQGDHICVAGVDLESGARVRPVIDGQLSANLLCTRGGPFDVGRIVDLGNCELCGSPPEVEDVRFDPRRVKVVSNMKQLEFLNLLRSSSAKDLTAFGAELVRDGRSMVTAEGKGDCSLGIVRSWQKERVTLESFGERRSLRYQFRPYVGMSVTDIRLYEADLATPSPVRLGALQTALQTTRETLLCFGLTRPWQRPGDDAPRHWLQLNAVHVPGWSGWQLCPPG